MKEAVKLVFVSNYINHHQIPFCNALQELLQGDFLFIQTEPMEEERIRMGWQETSYPYVRYYYQEPERCQAWIDNCQVLFFGGTDEESYLSTRLQEDKPLIRYSERLYKTGQWKAISPRGLLKKYRDHIKYRRKNIYMLCAGAYVASDFHLIGAYPGKLLRWGYFPATKEYDVDKLMAEKLPGNIVWAARFLPWKHPELALETARYLRDSGRSFHMDIIGGGEPWQEEMVRKLLAEYNLQEEVTLRGYCSPEEVRRYMERADIYLATSDRNEGWGAVINEAMNSGCALVADHMMGAVPYLITGEENGMIYEDGNKKMLFDMVEKLIVDRSLCRKLGRNAYDTIMGQWNAENGARRLLTFCVSRGFLEQRQIPGLCNNQGAGNEAAAWTQGPCSPAPIYSERYLHRRKK